MGWARVVKSRRHASLPGCGVTAGLLDFHTPKKESAVRGFGGAFGRFGLSFIHQASLSSLILSGQLTASGSGLSASGKHLSRLCQCDVTWRASKTQRSIDRVGSADKEQQTCIFNPITHANEFIWIEALNLTALLSTQSENAETERRDEAHG